MSDYLTTVEAIHVATARGVTEKQAKQDIIRALKFKSHPTAGSGPVFVIRFAGHIRPDRWGSWSTNPIVDWKRSTLLAYPALTSGWESLSTYARERPMEFVITRASVDHLWPAPADESDAGGTVRRGAKARYDWEAFEREVARKISEEGRIAPAVDPGPDGFKQADVERHMASWCERTWGRVPAESSIRDHVNQALRKADNSGR